MIISQLFLLSSMVAVIPAVFGIVYITVMLEVYYDENLTRFSKIHMQEVIKPRLLYLFTMMDDSKYVLLVLVPFVSRCLSSITEDTRNPQIWQEMVETGMCKYLHQGSGAFHKF